MSMQLMEILVAGGLGDMTWVELNMRWVRGGAA
jgi:hypothetical protein